ncbi:hypothetical protein [Salinivibrio phage CW02]|uniref:Uncharacterized protein n=1 Tax=Salinivibrio phage CW02 TaxID=1161935 RepID=H9D1G9_9CAUD|nr:tail protein [Salinivibrio phage CW02]AFE86211.1 hypothetical protein [Salinivibrio phage CW02]
MKPTLLEIVQEVLNDMDSDEVNSINDTFESAQVASICKTVFRNMTSNRNWPHMKRAVNLVPFSDNNYPTHMRVDKSFTEIVFINYNTAKAGETRKYYKSMTWLEPDDFLRRVNKWDTDSDSVDVILDMSGVEVAVRNDRAPEYYTSFDDDVIVFDSYDKEVDDTLQSSKTQCVAYVLPEFYVIDDHKPDLPEEAMAAYISEVKSQAFIKLKQQASQKDEQESVKQQRWLSRKSWVVNGGIKYPNYGRRGRK